MRIDQREGIELALVARVVERAEVTPIDFEAFAGRRLHAHEGALGLWLRTHLVDILAQDGVAAVIAERPQALLDDGGA